MKKITLKLLKTLGCTAVGCVVNAKKPFAVFLTFIITLVFLSSARATDWYVVSGGAGAQNGTSWTDAWPLSKLDTGSSTWATSLGINPGDTIWLAGGTYTDNLAIKGSGSAGYYINIKRVLSTDTVPTAAAGWSGGYDSQVIVAPSSDVPCYWNGSAKLGSYICIDGRVDKGISFQLASLNNTFGQPNYYPNASPGAVYFSQNVDGTHDVILTNVDMVGPASAGALTYSANSYLTALSFTGGPSLGSGIFVSNVVVSHCHLHSTINLVLLTGVTNAVFDHCEFYDCPFDTGLGNHNNVIQWAFSGDISYRYCTFSNWYNEGIMIGGVSEPGGASGPAYIYGNVFIDSVPGYGCSIVSPAHNTQTIYFYNNTCVNFTGPDQIILGAAGTFSTSTQWRNNIYWDAQIGSYSGMDMDYEFTDASSLPGSGTHNITSGSNPFVNSSGGDYHLASGSQPINAGTPLTSPSGKTYDIDPDGVSRPQYTYWDIGAYEYSGCLTPPSGLVAWWRGENNTMDTIGNNDGTLEGNAVLGHGYVGQGFVFDGDHSAVEVADESGLELQDFTIETWIKRTDATHVSAEVGITDAAIFNCGPGGYGFGIYDDGRLNLATVGVGDVNVAAGITDTAWHHVAVTKSGTTVHFYVDGTPYTASAYSTTFTFGHAPAIGGVGGGDYGHSFSGGIDEVSVYDHALTSTEIQNIYYAGSAGKCFESPSCVSAPSGIVAWWRGQNSTADSIGSNDGTLEGDTTFSSARVGQGFVFDGDHDAVEVADDSSLHLQDFTIEAWIKRASTTHVSTGVGITDAAIFNCGPGGYGFGIYDDGRLNLATVGVGDVDVATGITDTVWHHVAVTKYGTTVLFYVDGTQYTASAYSTTFTFGYAPAIGGVGGGDYSHSFNGAIDEVTIYDHALTSTEIQGIYHAKNFGKCLDCVSPPSGIVAWWRGENNTLDSVGNNDGVLFNDVVYSLGDVGQGFVLDGSYSVIQVADQSALHLQDFTIEAWVKRASATYISMISTVGAVFDCGYGGYGFGLFDNGHLFLSQNGMSYVEASTAVTDTAWHHVAVTKNGTTVLFYVDGIQYTTSADSVTYTFGYTPAIGGAGGTSHDSSFYGTIDEVAIYNRALTATEVQQIFSADYAGKCP